MARYNTMKKLVKHPLFIIRFAMAFLLCLFFTSNNYAQHFIRPNISLAYSSVDDVFSFSKFPSVHGGLEYKYKLPKDNIPFSFLSGVAFFNTYTYFHIRTSQIQIPLLIGVEGGKKVKFEMSIGPAFSHIISYAETDGFKASSRFLQELNKSSINMIERVGLKVRLKSNQYIGFNLTIMHGLTQISYRAYLHASGTIREEKATNKFLGFGLFYELGFVRKKV